MNASSVSIASAISMRGPSGQNARSSVSGDFAALIAQQLGSDKKSDATAAPEPQSVGSTPGDNSSPAAITLPIVASDPGLGVTDMPPNDNQGLDPNIVSDVSGGSSGTGTGGGVVGGGGNGNGGRSVAGGNTNGGGRIIVGQGPGGGVINTPNEPPPAGGNTLRSGGEPLSVGPREPAVFNYRQPVALDLSTLLDLQAYDA